MAVDRGKWRNLAEAVSGVPLLLFPRPRPCVAVEFFRFLLENFRLRNRHYFAEHTLEVAELVVRVALGIQFLSRLRDRLVLHSSTSGNCFTRDLEDDTVAVYPSLVCGAVYIMVRVKDHAASRSIAIAAAGKVM